MEVSKTHTFYPPPVDNSYQRHRGSGFLIISFVSAVMIALISLSITKVNQLAYSGHISSNIVHQAQQYADMEAFIVKETDYLEIQPHIRADIQNSDGFQSEVTISEERDFSENIKQKTVTINIYKEGEVLPRYVLDVIKSSAQQNVVQVPIGTVIIWASKTNPMGGGIWLECNGQSCSAYPALASVLGSNNVPNYQGVFLRGYGSRTSSHYNTVTHVSGALGVLQGDAIRNIYGQIADSNDLCNYGGLFTGAFKYSGSSSSGREANDQDGRTVAITKFNASNVVPTANENRPINIAVRYFIKAA